MKMKVGKLITFLTSLTLMAPLAHGQGYDRPTMAGDLRNKPEREEAFKDLTGETVSVDTVKDRIHHCFLKTADIVMQRNRRFKQIETELYEKEKISSNEIF